MGGSSRALKPTNILSSDTLLKRIELPLILANLIEQSPLILVQLLIHPPVVKVTLLDLPQIALQPTALPFIELNTVLKLPNGPLEMAVLPVCPRVVPSLLNVILLRLVLLELQLVLQHVYLRHCPVREIMHVVAFCL